MNHLSHPRSFSTHTHSANNLLLHCVLVLILIRILFAVLRLCNIKFELTLTRWPIHTGYGTMRVYRVILAELPNQFEEKRNAFPIIDLAWRLSVTQHQTCLSSHIHSNVLYILFCIFISGAIVLSQVIRTIMHCNKIIPFFSVEFVSFITLTCNSFLETPSTSVQSSLGRNW